jgi:ABC-2 type transport system permease protein/lipopolysaccharide transport system permease protein
MASSNQPMTKSLQLGRAWSDLVRSAGLRQLWLYHGWEDIKQRYRRSVLGPFWITISMATTILVVGILYAKIFRMDVATYLPYFAVGLMIWTYIISLVVEGCMIFINDGSYIRQVPVPLLTYVFKAAWRSLITFAHTFIIFVFVALYFGIWPGWGYLEAAAGLALITFNGIWCSMFLAILSARYRDIPQVVQNVMGVAFFLTPILWNPDTQPERIDFVDYNPFYHFLEIVRAPLLGGEPKLMNWIVAIGISVAGSLFAFLFFARYRRRIAYWV